MVDLPRRPAAGRLHPVARISRRFSSRRCGRAACSRSFSSTRTSRLASTRACAAALDLGGHGLALLAELVPAGLAAPTRSAGPRGAGRRRLVPGRPPARHIARISSQVAATISSALLPQHVVGAVGLGQLGPALVASRLAEPQQGRQSKLELGHARLSQSVAGPLWRSCAGRRSRSSAAWPGARLAASCSSAVPGLLQRGRLLDRLPQVAVDLVLHVDGRVDRLVAAAAIRADGNQVFVVAVGGQQLADRVRPPGGAPRRSPRASAG